MPSFKPFLVLLVLPISLLAQDYDTTRERYISFSQSLNNGNKGGLELRKQMRQRPIYVKYSVFHRQGRGSNFGMSSSHQTLMAVPQYHTDSTFALRSIGTWKSTGDFRLGLEYFKENGPVKLIIGLDALGGISRSHFTETIAHYEIDGGSSEYVPIPTGDELYATDNYMRVDHLKMGLAPAIGMSASITQHLSCLLFVRNETTYLSPLSTKVIDGQAIDSNLINASASSINSLFYIDLGIGYRF